MTKNLRNKLIKIARQEITDDDPSHDFEHALRVLNNAEIISKNENADLDIIIPAALFHDVVNHPKHSYQARFSADESALLTKTILNNIEGFSKNKINKVCSTIKSCSFSKGIKPDFLEAKILQDADWLEATGAISIMRTFSTCGQLKRSLYSKNDPFCKKRKPDSKNNGLDLFYDRLLRVKNEVHTNKAKEIARRRTKILRSFLKELEMEFKEK